jgi:hypothetical protein
VSAEKFTNNDKGYRAWLVANSDGFVLNVRSVPDPEYIVLHRAACHSISNDGHAPDAFTGRTYRKICATTVADLKLAAKTEGRRDGKFSKCCGLCKP